MCDLQTVISLDLYIAYLRAAFHTCYYCAVITDHLEELQRKCIKHERKPFSCTIIKPTETENAEKDKKADESEKDGVEQEKDGREKDGKDKRGSERNGDLFWIFVVIFAVLISFPWQIVGGWSGWTPRSLYLSIETVSTPASTGVNPTKSILIFAAVCELSLMVVSGSLPRQLNLTSSRRMKASSDAKRARSCSELRHLLRNISPISIQNS